MDFVKKITKYLPPSEKDTCEYNTLWIRKYRDGLSELYLQKSVNRRKSLWDFLGFQITEHVEEFWRDEESFLQQAAFLFQLDEQEVAELKSRLPHSH